MRRIRSSINGVLCSRLIVLGAFIDDGVDDEDEDDVTVGRGNFELDRDRNRAF